MSNGGKIAYYFNLHKVAIVLDSVLRIVGSVMNIIFLLRLSNKSIFENSKMELFRCLNFCKFVEIVFSTDSTSAPFSKICGIELIADFFLFIY